MSFRVSVSALTAFPSAPDLSSEQEAPRLDQRWALQALQPKQLPTRERIESYVGLYQGMVVKLQGDHLVAQLKSHAPMVLKPMTEDEFAVVDERNIRIKFMTDPTSAVVATELITADGPKMRFAREG